MEPSVSSLSDSQSNRLWSIERARSPLIGTAIHDGHLVQPHLLASMALDETGRLREEDPFTARFMADIPNRITVYRSRFELDLNRAPEGAIYLTPEQSWGLEVWREPPGEQDIAILMRQHASYYSALCHVLTGIEAEHGGFVLLDMHSYNHRRAGPEALATQQEDAPDINIGTSSMDRARWTHVLDPFIDTLRQHSVGGRPLDVRENVAFQGKGEQTRFVHEHFPKTGCAIAVEFKKIFMDEWTGQPDEAAIAELRAAVRAALPGLEQTLGARP
ncbi:N-formylglutamate amidohydrolase [Devosia sp. Root685]|uniref:N-formylglutamate amidohydrolase n=1 Tax=Devosia sp. Root685 TaxID=1736587 RepID=UPI0006F5B5BE|nr:N-formylglutamate amidohydrolase [Devosia sp. Root685]KRA97837.1 N-formylglutamate amidohydrolase [Devosia sp. Root685]